MHPLRPARRDPAVKEAHEVVGLYGDPDTSWGIAVDLGVRDLVAGQAAERLAALCSSHGAPGRSPGRGGGRRGGLGVTTGRPGERVGTAVRR